MSVLVTTRGPWRVENGCVHGGTPDVVLMRAEPQRSLPERQRQDNLRAVSVVPEMLAACMALVGAYEAVDPAAGEAVDWNDVDRAFEFAKKAVKKLNL